MFHYYLDLLNIKSTISWTVLGNEPIKSGNGDRKIDKSTKEKNENATIARRIRAKILDPRAICNPAKITRKGQYLATSRQIVQGKTSNVLRKNIMPAKIRKKPHVILSDVL